MASTKSQSASAETSRVAVLAASIEALLASPVYFRDVLEHAKDQPYRDILRAWSDIRSRLELDRDELGRYWLKL